MPDPIQDDDVPIYGGEHFDVGNRIGYALANARWAGLEV